MNITKFIQKVLTDKETDRLIHTWNYETGDRIFSGTVFFLDHAAVIEVLRKRIHRLMFQMPNSLTDPGPTEALLEKLNPDIYWVNAYWRNTPESRYFNKTEIQWNTVTEEYRYVEAGTPEVTKSTGRFNNKLLPYA